VCCELDRVVLRRQVDSFKRAISAAIPASMPTNVATDAAYISIRKSEKVSKTAARERDLLIGSGPFRKKARAFTGTGEYPLETMECHWEMSLSIVMRWDGPPPRHAVAVL
jgi:hypothetical protein